MNGSDAPPASMVHKITRSRYVTLHSLISSPVLAGGASEALLLPPCSNCSEAVCLAAGALLLADLRLAFLCSVVIFVKYR
jgi:hypothetical protein